MVYLPKRELVRVVVAVLEAGRLKIAKGLPLADGHAGAAFSRGRGEAECRRRRLGAVPPAAGG